MYVAVTIMTTNLITIIESHRVRSVNSKSFIFGSDFFYFSEEKMDSDLNTKLLLFTERTNSDD